MRWTIYKRIMNDDLTVGFLGGKGIWKNDMKIIILEGEGEGEGEAEAVRIRKGISLFLWLC